MSRYSKGIAALLGTVTPAMVVFILGLAHVHVDAAVATAVCVVLGTVATILAPANAPAKTVPVAPVR